MLKDEVIWKMNAIYTVMYNDVNYYEHIMTPKEKEIADELKASLILSLSKQWGLNGLAIKYSEDIGYYVIEDNDRGHYSMRYGFPTKDRAEAFITLLSDGSKRKGFSYELANRDKLQKEWRKSNSLKYDGRKYAFEYSLNLMKEVLGVIPEEYITHYQAMMNFHGMIWEYNIESEEFKCIAEA